MNNVLKQLLTLVFGLVFMAMAGTAMAQQTADVTQYGYDHVGTIDQVGTLNRGVIEQGASGATAVIDDHLARITQTGVNNRASVDQDGDGNPVGLIDQLGDDNRGTQVQNIYGSDPARAEIDQDGNRNRASQDQGFFGGFSGTSPKAFATQIGDDNRASQVQNGSGQMFRSSILQDGNLNRATLSQSGTSGAGFFSAISQTGDGNNAAVSQSN